METYRPIENYGIIGDLATAALVGMDSSIDFMCFPDFDSPTIFAALLDHKRGGYFKIAPATGKFTSHQRYLPDTNILLTRFLGDAGIAEISDFMPIQHLGHSQSIVRRIKIVRGEMIIRMICAPQFDYGRCGHILEKRKHETIFVPDSSRFPSLRLRCNVPVRIKNGQAVAELKMRTNQKAFFILEEAGSDSRSKGKNFVSEAFKETMNYWLAWMAKSSYRGRWREMVNRSALTLKLLTSQQHGSIVAAPTFGLPEMIGGRGNWDYRYTWIRDASFTMFALMRIGFKEEAQAFMRWIEQRCQELKPGRPLQVMYRLDGKHELPEKILDHFEGYRKSRPVRIGNAASKQLQLDIYGELLDSVFIYNRHVEPISYDFWANIVTIVDWICQNWNQADNGIWERRNSCKPYLYSRVMCWLAVERALKMARENSYPAPAIRWLRARNVIFKNIHRGFWNESLKAFVRYPGGSKFDASAFLLPPVQFISSYDPRWQSTMKAMERNLVADSLVYRFHPHKNNDRRESTFTVCSFWYIQALTRSGDLRRARILFEKLLGYSNHLGLYAEEIGPCGEHLGNFPLALSHIGLISAAWYLDQKLSEEAGVDVGLKSEPNL
ncbi:MAG TPA: glycoside hydrolase family 15 protein [Pseudomonadales bacterium]|nr:glycoside hydrolase family 15 protein [Pseudomonadales bacterium]